MFQFAIFGLET